MSGDIYFREVLDEYFLRNLFFGPSQGPQFPAAKFEADVFDGEELARSETVRGVERRGSSAEEDFLPLISGMESCKEKSGIGAIFFYDSAAGRAFCPPPNACRGERCGAWGRIAPIRLVGEFRMDWLMVLGGFGSARARF